MKQITQVVLLPTEKASNSTLHSISKYLMFHTLGKNLDIEANNQHLYLLSDEEIKEGDWITDFKKVYQYYEKDCGKINPKVDFQKKIIATTDESLEYYTGKKVSDRYAIKKQLPQIPELFIPVYIKAYNEGKPITEVLVEYEALNIDEIRERGKGFLNQDNFKLKLRPDNTIILSPSRTYTRDEVKILCRKAFYYGKENYNIIKDKPETSLFQDWSEQNL